MFLRGNYGIFCYIFALFHIPWKAVLVKQCMSSKELREETAGGTE
jgi:hypothetical protein